MSTVARRVAKRARAVTRQPTYKGAYSPVHGGPLPCSTPGCIHLATHMAVYYHPPTDAAPLGTRQRRGICVTHGNLAATSPAPPRVIYPLKAWSEYSRKLATWEQQRETARNVESQMVWEMDA